MKDQAPHNLEAEMSVLGAVLIKPMAFDEVAVILKTDDFFFPGHRQIYDAMIAVKARRQPLDAISVADELKVRGMLPRLEGGEAYLLKCANAVPSAENVGHYARIVKEKASLRQLIAACAEVMSRAYGDFGVFEEFLAEAHKTILGVTMSVADKRETLEDLSYQVQKEIEDSENGIPVARVPTGIRRLDRILKGGLRAEHLIVPLAQTSIGKSSFAFQVGFRAADRHQIPALIITAEMSKQEVFVKGAATVARVDTNIFNPPVPPERAPWEAILHASNRAVALKDLVQIEQLRDIGRIIAVATSWRTANPGPRAIIVVDYLQRLRGHRGKGESRREEIEHIASDLKDLAVDLKCPLVSPAQIDNDAVKEDRAPLLGDVREAKGIDMAADVVLGIHRKRLEEAGEAEITVLKHRGGRVGAVPCQWKGPWQGFEDEVAMEEEERRYR